MKTLKNKTIVIGLFLSLLLLISSFFSFVAISKAEDVDDFSNDVLSYRLSLDNSLSPDGTLVDAGYFATLEDVSENATKVFIDFEVIEFTGKPRNFYVSAFCDDYLTRYTTAGFGSVSTNFYSGRKFRLEFCLDVFTGRILYYSEKLASYTLLVPTGTFDSLSLENFGGIFYGANDDTSWSAELVIKCYDDTGKDLGVTTNIGYSSIFVEDENTNNENSTVEKKSSESNVLVKILKISFGLLAVFFVYKLIVKLFFRKKYKR